MINAILVLGVIGAVCGALLGIADSKFKVEVDAREQFVLEHLANANCGGCGYPGCAGFAAAVMSGEVTDLKQCKPTKPDAKAIIAEYLANNPGPDGSTIIVKH